MEYEISSVIEYLQIINDLNKKDINMVYRGQADVCWEPIPSIYRNKYYSGNEKDLLVEIRKHNFTEFKKEDLFINELIKMQHYGIPTPLLDWTKNPLNALFFAVTGKPNRNGHVLAQHVDDILKFEQKDYKSLSKFLYAVYNNFSDDYIDGNVKEFAVKFLVNNSNEIFIDPVYGNQRIRVQDGLFSVNLLLDKEAFNKFKHELIEYILDDRLRSEILSHYDIKDERGRYIGNEYKQIIDNDSIIEYYYFYGERHINDIIQNIKGRIHKDGNEGEIKPILDEFYKRICQQLRVIESFILNSLDAGEYYSKPEIISEMINDQQKNQNEIIILAKNKCKILEELDEIYSINSSTIYPDVEGFVQYLNNKYS